MKERLVDKMAQSKQYGDDIIIQDHHLFSLLSNSSKNQFIFKSIKCQKYQNRHMTSSKCLFWQTNSPKSKEILQTIIQQK